MIGELNPNRQTQRLPIKATVAIILAAIVALSLLAKTTAYLPKSNPAHYISATAKMERANPPASVGRVTLRPVSGFIPPPLTPRITREDNADISPINRVAANFPDRHRSPPRAVIWQHCALSPPFTSGVISGVF
jgi:hypothetical protein